MAIQSYGGSGLFGQRSFGDYSGLSGGVPVQMTPQQIQQQLAKQQDQYGGQPSYYDLYNSQETSPFQYNVGSRVGSVRAAENNPYLDAPPDLLRTALLQADYIKQQEVNPVSLMTTVDSMNVGNDQGDTSSNVAASQKALPVNTGYSIPRLVSDSPIVSGVFPEVDAMQRALYQQKQNEAMQAQAMQFARLSPMEQAQYSLYLGGQQLGGAIGGALGAKDPQLQMIGLQSRILSELDPSDPDQNIRIAKKYGQAAPELAMNIYQNALSSKVKIAQANKERQAAIGVPLQVSNRINELKQKMRMLPPDSVEYQDAEEEITRLMKPEKPELRPSVGSDTERISLDKYGKNYYDLTQAERSVVSKAVEEDAIKKAPKFQVDLKDPTAVAKANLDVMNKWEGFLKQGGDVEVASRFKALQSSVSLAQGGNPTADGATIFNIGKIYDPSGAVQEGDKTTILGNPSIPRKIQGYAQRVFDGGSLTPEQRIEILKIGTQLIKGREEQLQIYRKQYIKKNKTFGGDDEDILNPYEGLIKIDSSGAVEQIPTQKSGKSAKSWNDLN